MHEIMRKWKLTSLTSISDLINLSEPGYLLLGLARYNRDDLAMVMTGIIDNEILLPSTTELKFQIISTSNCLIVYDGKNNNYNIDRFKAFRGAEPRVILCLTDSQYRWVPYMP